jgi:hypothetical protein
MMLRSGCFMDGTWILVAYDQMKFGNRNPTQMICNRSETSRIAYREVLRLGLCHRRQFSRLARAPSSILVQEADFISGYHPTNCE